MIKFMLGDCRDKLKELDDNSVDSVVCDPPYELGFMGKKWDASGIAYDVGMWKEVLRVMKPGAHLLAFGGTRTYHRMTCAIEDAGFEIRDCLQWLYGSGFPKSYNIGKCMDKFLKTGDASWNGTGDSSKGALGYSKLQYNQGYRPDDYSNRHVGEYDISEDVAKDWEGWGSALKPANEPIVLARKPLGEKNIVENVLKWGTGGINIDESRIGEMKRFPVNVLLDEKSAEMLDEQSGVTKGGKRNNFVMRKENSINYGGKKGRINTRKEYNDVSGVSRFFYVAKASKKERELGLGESEERLNVHPTVKPIKLMEYLVRLITPKGGVVLDPFMGSGTTGMACKKLGVSFIGIELDEKYFDIAEKRINNYDASV